MKKLVLAAILAVFATGCASMNWGFNSSVTVVVLNDCKGSTLLLDGPQMKGEQPITYGERYHITLHPTTLNGRGNALLYVRGRDAAGDHTGTASRKFVIAQRMEERETVWEIRSLQGGSGCKR